MNVLNQARLIDLRLGRGIAARQLARDCGIEIAVLNRLETTEHPSLTNVSVSAIVRLANYLGVQLGELFTDNGQGPDTQPAPSDDAAALGALLTALKTEIAVVALADGLGWDIPRVHAAADTLDRHLHSVGMTIFKSAGLVSLRPRNDSHREAEISIRRHPRASANQRLLTPARARILHRAARKPISPHSISNRDRANIATLVKAGVLVEDDRRHFIPAPDMMASVYEVPPPE